MVLLRWHIGVVYKKHSWCKLIDQHFAPAYRDHMFLRSKKYLHILFKELFLIHAMLLNHVSWFADLNF